MPLNPRWSGGTQYSGPTQQQPIQAPAADAPSSRQPSVEERRMTAANAIRVGFEKGVRPNKKLLFTLKHELETVRSLYDAKFGKGSSKTLIAAKRRAGFGSTFKEQLTILWQSITAYAQANRTVLSHAKPAVKSVSSPPPPATNAGKPVVIHKPKTITRQEFALLSPKQQSEFCIAGGKLVN
jgi:hypothetical protein